jgi:hypothetical protein
VALDLDAHTQRLDEYLSGKIAVDSSGHLDHLRFPEPKQKKKVNIAYVLAGHLDRCEQ